MTSKSMQSQPWQVLGNEEIIGLLRRQLENETISSAYLFLGQQSIGKRTTAEHFLQALLCHDSTKKSAACNTCVACKAWLKNLHPDFLHVPPVEKGKTGVERVRDIRFTLSRRPTMGAYKALLLEDVDQYTTEAANALLKSIEEPPRATVIVMTASEKDAIPETLLSRCQHFFFTPVALQALAQFLAQSGAPAQQAETIAHLANGCPGRACMFLRNPELQERFTRDANILLTMLQQPAWKKLTMLKKYFSEAKTLDAMTNAREALHVWLMIGRDLVLMKRNLAEFTTAWFARNELQKISERYTTQRLLHIMDGLESLKKMLDQHVQPINAFEAFIVAQ